MKKSGLLVCITLLMTAFFNEIDAQNFSDQFGKNRLQFSNFEWRFFATENYEVYYYKDGKSLAEDAIKILEKEYPRITNVIGYAPYIKTKIFIYTSLKDLQESNVGVDGKTFTENGQTDLIKLLVEVPFTGISSEFEETLVYHFSKTLLTDMMYGGNLIARFQSAYLLTLPEWFIDGMARYLAYGWNIKMDDFTRDLLKNKNVKHLDHFEKKEAVILGQSVWNYIALKYGKINLSNILNLTRIVRDEEKSIANSLSTPFQQFIYDWNAYYTNANDKIKDSYVSPSENDLFTSKTRSTVYASVAFNPDSSKVAYARINNGKFKIISRNLESGKEKTLYSGGVRFHGRVIASEIPTMSWIDNSTLGITFNRYGQLYLGILNTNNGRIIKKALPRLNQIKSIDFNHNGKLAVVSAEVKGQNDIYLLSMYRNAIKRLTKDDFDDVEPRFIPGTNTIVFASNRKPEEEITSKFIKPEDVYNLFIYDLDSRTDKISQITKTISSERMPFPINSRTIYYLSDARGINNLYRINLNTEISTQVTNYDNSILNYSISPDQNKLIYSIRNNRKEKVYLTELSSTQSTFTPSTFRTELTQALFVKEKIRLAKQKEKEIKDSIQAIDALKVDSLLLKEDSSKVTKPDDEFIDTEGFVFENDEEPSSPIENTQKVEKPVSFLTNYSRVQKEEDVTGPHRYEPQFSVDNITTTVFVDPVIGFGFRFETRINELLENHKFYGRLDTKADFKSGSYLLEYKYIKNLLDYKISHQRRAYNITVDPFNSSDNILLSDLLNQKYVLNDFKLGVSLPFSSSLRVEANGGYVNSRYINQNASAGNSNRLVREQFSQSDNYVLFNGTIVYDKTVAVDADHVEGTLGRISLDSYVGIENEVNSFQKVKLDLRHYQKLYRNLTFVTRIQYGLYRGESSPSFILGGVQETLFGGPNFFDFNPIISPSEGDPLFLRINDRNKNLLFNEFITDLRGYLYNRMTGQDVALFNAELRLPIVKFLTNEYVKSNFLRTLKFVGFYDIGAAWTGVSPFRRENSINTQTFQEGSFVLRLKNFQFPWLMSYGVGVRTTLLGYYVKVDMGIPVQEIQGNKRTFHLSLGYDF